MKEDWNSSSLNYRFADATIPRHYPSEGGLKLRLYGVKAMLPGKFRGIIQVKEDWNRVAEAAVTAANNIPRHYPSEGGLKLHFKINKKKVTANSEALSKWRRIETSHHSSDPISTKLFRGIIQVKEDWNKAVNVVLSWPTTYSEALSKWRRIETLFKHPIYVSLKVFRGIIQVKEDWNLLHEVVVITNAIIPRHYPSEGGLKHEVEFTKRVAKMDSEALSKWRRIETTVSASSLTN